MKYFLIAGEASGDLHAAALIEALKAKDPEAQFVYLGGDLMRAAAGTEPIIHYRDMAYMGFIEVAKHAGKIRKNFAAARKAIHDHNPDRLILIDYPSFNLKMAKYAKSLGIPVYYYIPPKVWAWKEWRVKTISKVVDQVMAIFPFEVDFYRSRGFDKVEYVGNPSVQEIDAARSATPSHAQFVKEHRLPDKPLIAILPGSRLNEIRQNLPIMTEAAKRFPQYRAVVAGAPSVPLDFYKKYTTLSVVSGCTYDLLACSSAALVTSGTATLEAALIGTPQVAMYYGSKALYHIMKPLLKIPFVTLPNLIADHQVIPELLMHFCTADAATDALKEILPGHPGRDAQLAGYALIREKLTDKSAPATAADIITKQ